MALQVPTTEEISDAIIASLEAALSQTIPLLPKAFSRVLAKVLAGVFILLYKYAGFSLLQMFVQYATMDETVVNGKTIRPLVEWGRLIGVGDPVAAIQAELTITVVVDNQVGNLDAQSQAVRTDTGIVYLTTSTIALDAPTKSVNILASSDQDGGDGSGDIGNLVAGDIVTFANPLPNIQREATVSAVVVTGAAAETPEAYRARILAKFQARPQGGAYADYRTWGLEVSGIINIYPYTSDTPGEVDVFAEADIATGGADGIPTGPQLTAVADAIELDVAGLATRRPANAAVNVFAITRTAFDITVAGLVADDVTQTKSDLETAVDESMRSNEPFIVGLSVLPRKDRITTAEIGGVVDAIVRAAGGTITSVSLTQGGNPISAATLVNGEKAKLGTPSYT